MLLAAILAAAGMVAIGGMFYNRNQFDQRPVMRRAVPYAVVTSITIVAVAGALFAANSHTQSGFNGNRGTAPSAP